MTPRLMNRWVVFLVAAMVAGISIAFTRAQTPDASAGGAPDSLSALSGRPDAVEGQDMLGGTYQNPTAGISFRTPGACQQIKGAAGDEIARFVDPQKGWQLIASRSTTAIPMKLSGAEVTNARPQAGSGSDQQAGLLQIIVARLKSSNPGVEILRQDVQKVGPYQAGVIVARQSVGSKRQLFQQAIIQADEEMSYLLTMTSPAGQQSKGKDLSDPNEAAAANAFQQMLGTVKLLDRSQVREDQDQRLFRTRAFFVTLTPNRMRSVLIPEQWMRLIHNGKDIGYTYTVEEPDDSAGPNGIKIGVRSRSYPDVKTQVDGETWYYVSGDRKHENWSNSIWIQDLSKHTTDQTSELGVSDATTKRELIRGAPQGVKGDKQQPPVREYQVISLDVQTVGNRSNAPPVKQDLPPWYLPQALSDLLPRLLPIREPKTYLFAVYVSSTREVMQRYVDVGSEQMVDLNGKQVRAVPITDRLTLEGASTIHYMDPDTGKYLGSVNKQAKYLILPSTAAELQKIWANKADLSRPRQQPNPRAKNAGNADNSAPAAQKPPR